MFPLNLPSGAEILGAMITPAVLLSACGTLVLSTSHRLGRIVDRSRGVLAEAEAMNPARRDDSDDLIERRLILKDQIVRLATRIQLLQTALTALHGAIGTFVACSLGLGITMTIHMAGWLPVALGLLGSVSLFYASATLAREVRAAVRSSLLEMAYTRRVVERKTAPLATGESVAGPSVPPAESP